MHGGKTDSLTTTGFKNIDIKFFHVKLKCVEIRRRKYMSNAADINDSTFESEVLGSEVPVVVDFWAPWCGPCKMMSPILDHAAKELEQSVRVAKVNTEIETELAGRFSIRSIPTLVVFHNGVVIGQRSGAIELAPLLHWLKSLAA